MKISHSVTCLFLLITMLEGTVLFAQNTMSPYSIFGPGELMPKGFGRNIGMGRAGLAVKSDNRLNSLNPASYSGIEKEHFIFEIGIDGKYSGFKSNNDDMNGLNGGLRYLAVGFRYTSWWSTSMGLSPYTSVGFNINNQNNVEGSLLNYTSSFKGSGGITKAYWANSLKLTDNLFLGINSSFLFGPLTREENITQSDLGVDYIITQNDYLRSFYFDYGLQYSFQVKKRDYSLGVTFANKQSLRANHTFVLQNSDFSTISEEEQLSNITIPQTLGIGFSINEPGKFLLAVDYRTEKWAGLKYPVMSGGFVNAHNFLAGIEIRPWRESITNMFYQNWAYRLGASYNSSYLKLRNIVIGGYAVNVGAGIPLRNHGSTMNIAFEAGVNGTTANSLIRERYLLIHLNFSINELWFMKRKIY